MPIAEELPSDIAILIDQEPKQAEVEVPQQTLRQDWRRAPSAEYCRQR